jgi:uncharacterized protein YjiS (DUF1127 family)
MAFRTLAHDTALRGHRPARTPIGKWLRLVFGVRRSRHDLGALDDHMLNDIGVSREQAEREARRSTWDVPSNWRL